jgi:iron(III) transport system ATP-binding protein
VERKEPRESLRRKVGAALELVGLSQYADRRPSQLSGGQQQRVALARTVVIEPKLLLLDEPLSNLDKNLRVQMREELKNLQRTLGLTTIFVTHDQEEAMTTADRMAVLDKGVLQQVGTAAALFDFPGNRFVAGFVGTANLVDGKVTHVNGETLTFQADGVGVLVLPRNSEAPGVGPATMAFRPHTVNIRVRDEHVDASRTWLDGKVESSEFLGESSRYRVRVGEAVIVANQPHYSGLSLFQPGAEVRLGVESTQVRFLTH